ncbi:hypothetical protein BpHYR1_026007 [Brachionus plicatilis]|uniref:Uncharacterized protein n=1 Tax=Brachionus plicatilis TaxID=10195 RepID=A0A3M7R1B4_BRAPC|nr:hypothetical protein BpHYR1_026007 [Brachionus plicatilis]
MSGAVYDERPTCFLGENAVITMPHHNSAVSRSQAQDEKRGGWWQPHYVVFYESEEELYYGYMNLRIFVVVLSYEGAPGLTIIQYRILAGRELVLQLTLFG